MQCCWAPCRRAEAGDLCELGSPGAPEACAAGAPFSAVHFNALFGDVGSPDRTAAASVGSLPGQPRRSGSGPARSESGSRTPQHAATLEGRVSSSRSLFSSPSGGLQSPGLTPVRDIAGRWHARSRSPS
jgi:hypothetical protein